MSCYGDKIVPFFFPRLQAVSTYVFAENDPERVIAVGMGFQKPKPSWKIAGRDKNVMGL